MRVVRRFLAPLSAVAAGLVTLPVLAPGVASADTSPGPPILPNCAPEQFPHGGALRSAADVPYQIPFTATLGDPVHHKIGGGFLMINSPSSLFTVILGGPLNLADNSGSITAQACGTVSLPTEKGGINGLPGLGTSGNNHSDSYNDNFKFNNPIGISIGLKGVPGVPVLEGFGSAVGDLAASIDRTPAANGGLNVEFEASAKATSVISPCALLNLSNAINLHLPLTACPLSPVPVSGGECTVPIGDLMKAGIPSGDFGSKAKLPPGSTLSDYTKPVHLGSNIDVAHPPLPIVTPLDGRPVTGPITDAQAVLVSDDFPVATVDPNTPPSPDAPNATQTPSSLCSPSNAQLFNTLLGLPSPAGSNIFYAPGTFAVFTSS